MKAAFIEYLKNIGITEPIQERITTIYGFFVETCPEEVEDIFVSDFIREDGTREYTSIRFLSEKYTMLAIDFINKDDFRISPLRGLRTVRLQKRDYDFKKANERSRMSIRVYYTDDTYSDYQASKTNCDYLKDIFYKYYCPKYKQKS